MSSKIVRRSVASLLSAVLALHPVLVQAQAITPDGGAASANRPTVGAAPNGVPLVDIVTPNGRGLSHNKYGAYNVGTPGLILNNSNAETGISKLGGVTPGNPNLRNSGPATVILNEVTSGGRSALLGPTEVFGGRADVIVANPNGITCDGCGFINTPRATLTTGTPDVDATGRLSGFTVRGGDVTFGTKGGNFAGGEGAVDLFDIVSRTVRIDGPVNGKDLRITTGRNRFDYSTGEATGLAGADDASEFAIDGSALGAMQADRIRIAVTDKGAGVRMRNDMAANAGALTLSADGRISLGNLSGRDGVDIRSKSRQVEAKKITSKSRVTVKAASGVTLHTVAADGDVLIATGGLVSVVGELASLGNMELTASGAIAAGQVSAGRDAVMQAGAGITAGQVLADGAIRLSASSGNIALSGMAKTGGALQITATSGAINAASLVSFNNMTLTAGREIGIAGDLLAGGKLVASAGSLKAASVVSGVDFAATGASPSGTIVLKTGGDMRLTAGAGTIEVGSILTSGDLAARAGLLVASGITGHSGILIAGDTRVAGQVLGAGDVTISGAGIHAGAIVSGVDLAATAASPSGAILLTGTGDMRLAATAGDVAAGSLLSAGDMAVTAAGNITTSAVSHGTMDVDARDAITLSGQSLSAGDVRLAGSSIKTESLVSGVDFAATERAGGPFVLRTDAGSMSLTASGLVEAASLLSAGTLDVLSNSFRAGNATSHAEAAIVGDTVVTGQLLSASDLSVTGSTISAGLAAAGVDLAALENGSVALGKPARSLVLTASAGDIGIADLLSSGDAKLNAAGGVSGNALVHGDLSATAAGAINLAGQSLVGGNALLNANAITLGTLVSGVDFAATEHSSGSLVLTAGAGDMTLLARTGSIKADQLVSGGDLKARALQDIGYDSLRSFAGVDLGAVQGTISLDHDTVARGDITLSLEHLDLSGNRGKLATAGTLTVNAGSADLSGSTLTFGGVDLNLAGSADVSGASIRAVTADGGSGNIAISAATITTTPATALLAANDLTLTLASLSNTGQLAAGNDLTVNVSGNLTNTPTGLVYAGNDGRLLVEGDLFNDQGAILVGNDLTIAADADGARNRSVTNVSGLIKAGRDAFITTENLTNKRLFVPGLKEVVVLTGTAGEFRLNPDVADEPFMQLYQGWNDDTSRDYIFPDLPRQLWEDYQDRLWSRTVLADGSSYHAWTWISAQGPTGSTTIRNWIADRVPRDADGNITLDPDNPSKYFVVVEQGKPHDTSTTYSWDEAAYIGQTVTQEVFDGELAPEALIHTGRNLMIDATVLNNSSSSIEAEGNAALMGETLNNEGVMATRTTTLECHAQGACEAYDAKGRRNPSKDMANGTSVLGNVEAVSLASANIKAAGNLDISGFATVNNTSGEGSIAGHAALQAMPGSADPTAALAGMTAGGALFTPNAALGGLLAGAGVSASGTGLQPGALQLASADMLAALAKAVAEPDSGGFGGTIPGQVFLYETRAEFLDVGKFYGSGYFIDRIGYKPEREVPFLGDAYFENELVDVQLRQLAGQGLGKGSFVPGSDAIEQMKVLLDRGIAFAIEHGLEIGQQLSPELAASLTGTLVWYQKKIVAGIEVLVPTVYVADVDRATLTASGALISGGSLTMNVGAVDNSGTIAAKGDLRLAATTIAANGGSFVAGNDLRLDASRTITLTAQSVDIGGASVVNPNAMVDAGGNAVLKAGDTLKLAGAGVEVDGNALLTGRDVTLDAVKVENGGSENATGTRVNAGGDLAIRATNDVTVIGSSANAGGALAVTAENGSVNVVTKDVKRGTDDGYTTTVTTTQQMSQLTSGGDMRVGAGENVLLSGSALGAGGDATIAAGGDVNITAVANQSSVQFGANSGERVVNSGAEITAGGNVAVSAGGTGAGDLAIIGSSIAAGEAVDLRAAGNVTIAEAIDQETYDLHNKSGNGAHTDSHIAIETASGSSIKGESGVAISAGNDVTVSASTVEAGSADKTADLTIAAGGNIVVSSGKDVLDQDTQSRGHGFLQSNEWSSEVHDEATVASRLGASGTVTLYADKTVAIAGSEVTAGEDIAVSGESVAIVGAQEAHDLAIGKETSGLFAGSGDGFFSIWGEEEKEKSGSTVVNAASTITAGGDVSVIARGSDIDIIGSGIAAGGDIALSAANDVNVTPGAESAMSQETEKRSGFGISLSSGSGSASIGIGYGSAEDEVTQSSGTNALSTLSAGRDVTITAGNDINLQAAKVEAGQDIALYAVNDVNLLSAEDETNYAHRHEEFFAGISLNVQSSLISAGQQLADSASGLGDANGLYSLAPTALAAYKAGTALQQAGDGGSLGSASLTIGFTQQQTLETASSATPVPTTLQSGGSVAIVAEEGSITGHGVQIAAGFDANGKPVATSDPSAGNILLSAGEEIALYSAQGTSSTGFSATSSGASFGIDLDSGLPVASGSHATGEGDGTGVTNLNSHVTGTGTVVINSGANTVLKGAVVSGETVIANVGGDLLIESLQDTASYDEKSLGISAGFGPSGLSGGVNKGTVTGDFANVAEQSGIVAGSGGYHVAVEGGVDLIGGVIASTDTTGNSSLSADHLTFSDLENSSSASTSNIGLSASLPLSGSDAANAPLGGLAISPAVGQPAMESDGGTARATLTPGTLSLSSQTQDLAGLNTDLSKANTQVEIYDIDELKAKQRSAAALSELLNIGVGTLSEKLGFEEGSAEKIALHAAIGALTAELAGGNAATGALAGGASEIANGILVEVLKANPNLNAAQKAAITQWVAAAVGAAVGGELGAATALDNVNYNYLNHDDAEKLTEAKAACKNGDKAACEEEARLEKKDEDQQRQYLACRSTGYSAAGCDAVLWDVVVALSSYSGIAPFTLSQEDRRALLESNGNLDQLVKILAPYGIGSLSEAKREELSTLLWILTGDITGVTATPWVLEQIASGDPSSFAQVLGMITRNTAVAGLGKLVGKVDSGEAGTAIPSTWKPVGGAGAQINTPKGFTSYVTPDGDIVHVSPAGLVYGYDKSFGNRIDHVLAHTVVDTTKPTHTVFSVQGDDALALVDEAWLNRGTPLANDPQSYVVSMGKIVGTQGETSIKIVVTQVGSNTIATAYPVP